MENKTVGKQMLKPGFLKQEREHRSPGKVEFD